MKQPDHGLDPITVEVVRNKIEGIANEMQQTLLRSSFSPIVKEGLDASASLFTTEGETLAQACAIPVHLGTLIPVVAKILELFPVSQMNAGDAFIMNEPYLGGTHLPDIAIVTPIVTKDGRVVAISAAMTHHQDMGGMSPGSVPTNAVEIFQEGLRIPPLKFRDKGKYNETLVALIRQNVRIPNTVMGDLNAQLAACNVGARRVGELVDALGQNMVGAIFANLLEKSEELTRSALRSIPEGTYSYVDYNDNDGIELDKRIRFEVAVTIKDGNFHVDFTGSSAQVRGPFNAVPSGALRRHALRSVRSRIQRFRQTPVVSARSLLSCPSARSSTRSSRRPLTRGPPPLSAWPGASSVRSGRPFPNACPRILPEKCWRSCLAVCAKAAILLSSAN
ncbi:MAG: hydantoinase B/oxoprolinase family protein [Rhizobiales bacterium]|nr:hydantoinase B/oxoprolinase family protein [Hyphomicrobiales bacterium]